MAHMWHSQVSSSVDPISPFPTLFCNVSLLYLFPRSQIPNWVYTIGFLFQTPLLLTHVRLGGDGGRGHSECRSLIELYYNHVAMTWRPF